jgi:hypothetical protein
MQHTITHSKSTRRVDLRRTRKRIGDQTVEIESEENQVNRTGSCAYISTELPVQHIFLSSFSHYIVLEREALQLLPPSPVVFSDEFNGAGTVVRRWHHRTGTVFKSFYTVELVFASSM